MLQSNQFAMRSFYNSRAFEPADYEDTFPIVSCKFSDISEWAEGQVKELSSDDLDDSDVSIIAEGALDKFLNGRWSVPEWVHPEDRGELMAAIEAELIEWEACND